MDSETLTFLLRGGHVNMTDRIERGLWPSEPIDFSEVVRHLAGILESEKWFPRQWKPHKENRPIWEGGVIERQSEVRYVYRSQRHLPTDPRSLAENSVLVFSSATEATEYYLKWDLNLPGDLDGWRVLASAEKMDA